MAPRGKTATLNIVIAGDAKGAKAAMGQTEAGAKGLTRSVGGLATAVGGLLAGGAIIRWGKEAIDTYRSVGGELMALKRLTGGSDEFIPGLFVAAQQSGVAIDKLSAGIGILSSKIQTGAIDKLGIDTKNAAGEARSFEAILGDVMDRYAELEGVERTAFTRTLFGRGGGDMMKLLGKGREEMAGFVEEAKRLGITLNSEDLQKAIDNQRDFQLALTAAKVTMGKELLPVVTQFTSVLADNMPAMAQAVGTLASAFNALPAPMQAAVGASLAFGPAIRLATLAFGPLAAGVNAMSGSGGALERFRFGLRGVALEGGGAAGRVGLLLSRVAASPALMAGAAVGVGILTIALIEMADGAKRAKENADDLVTAAQATGDSIEQVFNEQLAKTIAGISGGFDIGDSGNAFRQTLNGMGVSASELSGALRGSDAEFSAFKDTVADFLVSKGQETLIGPLNEDLDTLRGSSHRATEQQRILTEANEELGVGTDEASEATERNTGVTGRNVAIQKNLTAAMEGRKSDLDSIWSARARLTSAEKAAMAAASDLADAERAAAGDSDEMRDALEAQADAAEGVQDALKGVTSAEEAVGEAQDRVREAQLSLNEARVEAKKRIEDLAQAARDAVLDERGADLAAREALEKLQDILRSPVSDLEKERAQLEYDQAVAAADAARQETVNAQAEAAAAAAAGVEGSQEVIDAKEAIADANSGVSDALDRVTEANEGVEDATKRVGEAEENTAQVAEDAATRFEEAKAAAETATRDVLDAQTALVTAVDGTATGVRFLQEALLALYPEGSQQRRDVQQMIRDLSLVLSGGLVGGPGGGYGSVDAAEQANQAGGGGGGFSNPWDDTRRRPNVQVNTTVIGSDVQVRRETERGQREFADRLARGMG